MERIFLMAALLFFVGCASSPTKKDYKLSETDRKFSDSSRIEEAVLLKLRAYTDSTFSIMRQGEYADSTDVETMSTPALSFSEQHGKATHLLRLLRDDLQKDGYTIFVSDDNFGMANRSDEIAVIKTTDQFKVLKFIGTDGINYGIDNDSLLSIIRFFDKKYSLRLTGAGMDWCEFTVEKKQVDWLAFAKEAYEVCPDIVDQGAGTVEAAAADMKKNNRLYFWWD